MNQANPAAQAAQTLTCPHCGSKETRRAVAYWNATSQDDSDNTSELVECQCDACATSFWI